ncbi:hypothetical protein EYF80_050377 [Liparis tanakae]|uniref:Uncharacterized protein n=1 Tax=Liparis tanakae TaxID=230148 RepID=A0A4Z2FFD8_9TELE|nr:hypothetical protein EYF80_050377 [Liparis tanakae]
MDPDEKDTRGRKGRGHDENSIGGNITKRSGWYNRPMTLEDAGKVRFYLVLSEGRPVPLELPLQLQPHLSLLGVFSGGAD